MNKSGFFVAFFVLVFVTVLMASPLHEDLESSATGHEHGRVQIKVYRGAGDHHFAPWGYWYKQPPDSDHH